MSQLVLPVELTGLTVNGKTPTPEPWGIIRAAAIRFKERHEDTHKVGSKDIDQCYSESRRGQN